MAGLRSTCAENRSLRSVWHVFIDETWIKTNMAPLPGWGTKGQRLIAKAPHGHWKTLTFVAALRCNRIEAPLVFDGPINGRSFAAYIKQALVPTLHPGDVVIFDNLGSHKGAAIRAMCARREPGCCFFRPTALISTPSNKSSPSSNTSCETWGTPGPTARPTTMVDGDG